MTMPNTESRGSGTEGAGQQGGGSAREQIREVKDQVVDRARSSLAQARDRAGSSLGESKGQFADQFGNIAEALRRTTEQLRSQDQERIAGITDTVARQVDQVANYLRNKDAIAMRTDLENLARRQPALVLGGALILGLMGARFLKSSRRDRRFRGETQDYGRTQRFGNGGYDQFSGSNPQFSGGFDQFSEDASEFERQSPASGRGGYQGGGYAGA
jgi:uncharacterized protein YjbJ (UPF0337 family)